MPLTSPSDLHHFLNTLGACPKKHLSQNFLIDANILQKILMAAEVEKDDYILEIGPGPGALTEALLERKADVVAVEKDPLFAHALHRFPELQVVEGDFLDFSFESLKRPAKVVANLPYHLTSPILSRLVVKREHFSTLTVMVQEEVARRMIARPGGGEYGSFTLFLSFYSEVSYCFRVSKHCFYPAPKVDSAVVHFVLKKPPCEIDEEHFFLFVRSAFQQRRKMVRTSLKERYSVPLITQTLEEMGVVPTARPEELSLENFLTLFLRLCG